MSDDVTKDIGGHKYVIRELDPGDTMDMFEALGTKTQRGTVLYANAVCAVRMIDEVPVVFPRTYDEIKKLARRIGTAGMNEVMQVVNKTADDTAEELEATKNSAGTPSS